MCYIFKPKLIQRVNSSVREGGAVREVQLGGSRGQSKCTTLHYNLTILHYTTLQSKCTIQVHASLALPQPSTLLLPKDNLGGILTFHQATDRSQDTDGTEQHLYRSNPAKPSLNRDPTGDLTNPRVAARDIKKITRRKRIVI